MKGIMGFIDADVDGKTLFTKGLIYGLKMTRYRVYTLAKYPFLI